MEDQRLKNSIAAGVEFLHRRQRPSGHFVIQRFSRADGPVGRECDISAFATACAVYCLQWIQGEGAEDIRRRALDALIAETRLCGLYRYLAEEQSFVPPGMRKAMTLTIVPDLDTTACASFILARYGRGIDSRDALLARRNAHGLFPSWVREPAEDLDDAFPFLIMVPIGDGLCCGVNANVLMYLGDGPETRAVSEYIRDVYEDEAPASHASWYEEGGLAYMCSRAFFEGAASLAPIRDALLKRLLLRQRPDGSFGTAMETAAGACTLLNFNAAWPELNAAIRFLTASQCADGGWPRGTFFIGDQRTYAVEMRFAGVRRMVQPPAAGDRPVMCYFGSKEATTLTCLEALSRFAEAR